MGDRYTSIADALLRILSTPRVSRTNGGENLLQRCQCASLLFPRCAQCGPTLTLMSHNVFTQPAPSIAKVFPASRTHTELAYCPVAM